MTKRFQITTFEKFSQFSRVADQSILAGLTQDGLKAHVAHLSTADKLNLSAKLNTDGTGSFLDVAGRRCVVQVHKD